MELSNDIAIIGISCRFPGANNYEEFWELLKQGLSAIQDIPRNRWDWKTYWGDPIAEPNKSNSKWGSFVQDVDCFDNEFFGISATEVEWMDPQQRIMLELAWSCFEDAGIPPSTLSRKSVGVFLGVFNFDFKELREHGKIQIEAHHSTGTATAVIPNRLSYYFNLTGPSLPVDTACSSSLNAIHMAAQSLQQGECELALAGGINLLLTPTRHISFSKTGMLSPTGSCKTFDASADGYVRGEGAGVILLKPLGAALESEDVIYGILKGSAVNHNGKTYSLTYPSPEAQSEVIRLAQKRAGVSPESISYVEAHGTGTPKGDPIEYQGLYHAFACQNQASQNNTSRDALPSSTAYCGLGSLKPNIGHLEAAAGVAGVIKVLLAMKYQTLPSVRNFQQLNPRISMDNSPFYIVEHAKAWNRLNEKNNQKLPRRAGVSSFGFGGTNAHVILEESPPPKVTLVSCPFYLIALSAKTKDALSQKKQDLLQFLQKLQKGQRPQDGYLLSLCKTLLMGREHFEQRETWIVSSIDDLQSQLASHSTEKRFGNRLPNNNQNKEKLKPLEHLMELSHPEFHDQLNDWAYWYRHGEDIEWKNLFQGYTIPLISLPTYPFARTPFPFTQTPPVDASNDIGLENDPSRERRFLKKQWEISPQQLEESPLENQLLGAVIIVTNANTRALANQVASVFSKSLLLDEDDSSHSQSEYLKKQDWALYQGFIDLTPCESSNALTLEELPAHFLMWLQQWIEWGPKSPRLALCVTRGLESFQTPSKTLSGATRVGLYRTLQSEYPHLQSRHMDGDPSLDTAALVQQIVSEYASNSEAPEVCYRQSMRYNAKLVEIPFPQSQLSPSPFVFPPEKVLWITGGTRGLGFLCAQHFVKHYGVKRLVLAGRETIPPRAQWKQITQTDSPLSQKIRHIQALESQGIDVWVSSISLMDESHLRQEVQVVKKEWGAIGGVIHCAGILDFENPAFIRKSPIQVQQVLAPKTKGLNHLIKIFGSEPLQFCLLFSSVSAVIPHLAAGQSDYAAANAAMDYLAEAYHSQLPIISLQWPSWKESGMGEMKSAVYQQSGLQSITDGEGLALLDVILTEKMGAVVLPAIVNPSLWQVGQLMNRALAPASNQGTNKSSVDKQVPMTEEQTKTWLIQLISRELKIAPQKLKPTVPFQEYGADSILLTQILRKLQKTLDRELDPSLLHEFPNAHELTQYFMASNPANLAQLPDESKSNEALIRASQSFEVAVVGMSCRFAGADSFENYWQLLAKGQTAIGNVPDNRWEGRNDESPRYGGFLQDVYSYDPEFFLIPSEDAQAMDPQGLLILEESLNAFYHAGYPLEQVKGSTVGVYLGARSHHRPSASALQQSQNPIVTFGQNYLATNVSQFFDLKGPSVVIDTACSSALVAMKLATQALQGDEITSALVGGVSLLMNDDYHQLFQERNLLSHTATFHIFDQRSDGVVLGEGIGMVLLKPLAQAKQDKDTIYATIKSIATNNDGRTAGPATPSLDAQKKVMHSALTQSGKQPEEIGYIEVNGSGSEVTDLLELKAIEAIYGKSAKRNATISQSPCALGSMKPNIGHPLCAEGMAGFIKLVLMLNHQQWVPFLSGKEPLTHFSMEQSRFYFNRTLTPFVANREPSPTLPTVALNCFADGGTNVHLILEGAPQIDGMNNYSKALPPPALKRRPIKQLTSSNATLTLGKKSQFSFHNNPWTQKLDSDHPMLKHHKAYGQSLLPGLAYIDMIYHVFREKGWHFSQLELRNLSIHHPLRIDKDDSISLMADITESQEGGWHVRLEGKSEHNQELYVTAEVHPIQSIEFRETEALVLEELDETVPLETLYQRCRELGLEHTGFMKARGWIQNQKDNRVVEVQLGPEASTSASEFMFHPVLLDGCVIGAGGVFSPNHQSNDSLLNGKLFLPLYYESFRATELIQKQCVTRIAKNSIRQSQELVYMTLEFFNETGKKVGALKNYTSKLVREPGLVASPPSEGSPIHEIPKNVEPSLPFSHDLEKTRHILKDIFAHKVQCDPDQVALDRGYYEMGLTSSMLLEVVTEIEKAFASQLKGRSFPPTLLFEYTTINELADYLAESNAGNHENSVAPENNFPPSQISHPSSDSEAVAIIGMAGRYPGASNLREFWNNLKSGKDCITEIPQNRWDWHELDGVQAPSGKNMSKWGGFLDNVECFDPHFFHISPREAKTIDPQERLFLEVCWETMEDAGYTPENLVTKAMLGKKRKRFSQQRPVGVFVGVMHKDYTLLQAENVTQEKRFPLTLNYASIANRVSYFCDFHGPSMAIDTVCSSSLTAVHLAIESLRRGESQVALAGGVNLSLHPHKYMTYGMMDMHSSDGYCHTFGKGGDGYVSAEGVGAVLLKPLNQAVSAKDHIYAIIKGSSINHVGKTSGLTVPSPVAQANMILDCFDDTEIDPRSLGYVEAHGTGTSLGDPIEIEGLTKAFQEYTQDTQFCSIGSVKSNIGHAESAAGISGLHKLALQLYYKTLVPSLHSETINPYLKLERTPFYVQQKLAPWEPYASTVPRRGGLSSFGAFGSNVHLLVEEYQPQNQTLNAPHHPVLIPLSAKTEERLHVYAETLIQFLRKAYTEGNTPDLQQIAYTFQGGRKALEYRVIFLVMSLSEWIHKLELFVQGKRTIPNCCYGNGQVAEWTQLFSGDEDAQTMVNQWVQKGKVHKIAEAWSQGLKFEWPVLESLSQVPIIRTSLPTYPFAKETYWVEQSQATESVSPDLDSPFQAKEVVYFDTKWQTLDSPFVESHESAASLLKPDTEGCLFVLCPHSQVSLVDGIKQWGITNNVYPLHWCDDIGQRVKEQTLQLFHYCKSHIQNHPARPHWLIVYLPFAGTDYPYRCLMGMLRTISQESPFFKTKLVFDTALAEANQDLMKEHLFQEVCDWKQSEVLFEKGQSRKVLSHSINKEPRLPLDAKVQQNGVYWITGGMGGLGQIFAKYLGKQYNARLVLTGRSVLNAQKQTMLDILKAEGIQADYYACDISDRNAVEQFVDKVRKTYGPFKGILHCAGMTADNYLGHKTEEEVTTVLAPKVESVLIMDELTKTQKLDFFVTFSSIAALGNAGQLDYATGNAFLDVFAKHRNQLVQQEQRSGKTVSINWPLWQKGGMAPGKTYEKIMYEKWGGHPLRTMTGKQTFELAIAGRSDQIGVLEGDAPKIQAFLTRENQTIPNPAPIEIHPNAKPTHEAHSLHHGVLATNLPEKPIGEIVQETVIQMVSKVIEISPTSVDLDTPLADLGADSILLTELANLLNHQYHLNYVGAIFIELHTPALIVKHLLAQEMVHVKKAHLGITKPTEALQATQTLAPFRSASTKAEFQKASTPSEAFSPVAIIGYDCQFSGAPDADTFWENLCHQKSAIQKVTPNQWQSRGIDLPEGEKALYETMQWAALMETIDQFDAAFWEIDNGLASQMDPQQRLLLQSIWRGIEHAGYSLDTLTKQKVGLFVALDAIEYKWVLQKHNQPMDIQAAQTLGMVVNQLSYYFDFRGPSEVVDNACASVYVALNRAAQALAWGECDIAIVGGAKVVLDPMDFQMKVNHQLLSDSGKIASFGDKANGYIRGEGVGCVVLKPSEVAQTDHNSIHAVMIGAASSHNGNETLSTLAPSAERQVQTIKAAYQASGINPETVNYIEAHGTATDYSDISEVAAFKQFFKESLESSLYENHQCYISTVKPNIGHLEAASGIASLIKSILALKYKKIAPIATFSKLHPAIFIDNTPIRIPQTVIDWKPSVVTNATQSPIESGEPRRVGLHSIGLGGVNAHIILEEPQPSPRKSKRDKTLNPCHEILVISAKSRKALEAYCQKWLTWVQSLQNQKAPVVALKDLAYASQVGRTPMPYRVAYVVNDLSNLEQLLHQGVHGFEKAPHATGYGVVNTEPLASKETAKINSNQDFSTFEELCTLADAWVAGTEVDWQACLSHQLSVQVTIPTYPFDQSKHWCHDPFTELFFETFMAN